MASRFLGKVALVTAATTGIGFAIARRIGLEGGKVMICSRKEANVKSALGKLKSDGIKADGTTCHVSYSDQRKKLIEKTLDSFGSIDLLVCNAGTNPTFGSIFDTTELVWDKLFDTNVKSTFFLTKEVVPHIEKRGGGAILFTSSIGGYNVIPEIACYSITKTTLLAFPKAFAKECAAMNIRVNGIAPGLVKTKFSSALTSSEDLSSYMLQQIPLGRFGEPSDIAGAATFLLSNDADYITGETMVISGGMISRL